MRQHIEVVANNANTVIGTRKLDRVRVVNPMDADALRHYAHVDLEARYASEFQREKARGTLSVLRDFEKTRVKLEMALQALSEVRCPECCMGEMCGSQCDGPCELHGSCNEPGGSALDWFEKRQADSLPIVE